MALLGAYTDIAYANSVNSNEDAWNDASSSEKNNALIKARYYIDSTYTCSPPSTLDVTDLTTVPDEYQVANSILANVYLEGTLYTYDPLGDQSVVSKRVKADTVESETTYSGFMNRNVKKGDKYPEVSAILSPYCSIGSDGSLGRV